MATSVTKIAFRKVFTCWRLNLHIESQLLNPTIAPESEFWCLGRGGGRAGGDRRGISLDFSINSMSRHFWYYLQFSSHLQLTTYKSLIIFALCTILGFKLWWSYDQILTFIFLLWSEDVTLIYWIMFDNISRYPSYSCLWILF